MAPKTNIVQGAPVYSLGFPAVSSQPLSQESGIDKLKREVLSKTIERALDEADFRYSIENGIVRQLRVDNNTEFIQHSAAISPGSSGGPLIYEDGKVVGMNAFTVYRP